jgi:hypothetical protein
MYLFFFLSQFAGLFRFGSSYFSPLVFILPFFAFFFFRFYSYRIFFATLAISLGVGLVSTSYFTVYALLPFFGSIILFTGLYLPFRVLSAADHNLFNTRLRFLLTLFFPTFIVCSLESFARIYPSSPVTSILINIKDLFVRDRLSHTYTTISGLFPEHGLFSPCLLMIIGIICLYLSASSRTEHARYPLFTLYCILWLCFIPLHNAGLFFFSLSVSLCVYFLLLFLQSLRSARLPVNHVKFFVIAALIFIVLYILLQFVAPWFAVRISILLSSSTFFDQSFAFKSLPFFILVRLSPLDLLLGTGVGSFSHVVLDKLSLLPEFLTSNSFFVSNLAAGRFAVNSLFVVTLIELGFILFAICSFCSLYFLRTNVSRFILSSSLLRLPVNLFLHLAGIFFLASFISCLGAVPSLYPFPWISLGFLAIIITRPPVSNANYRL